MASNHDDTVELKEEVAAEATSPELSSEKRRDMAVRVENDCAISGNETGSSDMLELSGNVLEELTGGSAAPLDTDVVQRMIGTVINGRYRIDSVIGRGGMGVVFKATHQTLDRPVVIKVLRPSKVDSNLARKRFEREAKRLCLLDHPNVVTIYDFGYHDRLGYLVMEHVNGITLSAFLKKTGPLTFGQFAPMAAGVLSGLSAAHKAGIVHRDIKASNAMLLLKKNMVERIKLLDFGLAKLVTGSEDLTKKSELIGSMSAMAPERILGQEGDERVDIYAFGVMSYYLLSGEKPFTGEDVRVLYSHVHEEPPPLAEALPPGHDVPSTLIEFVHLCLAKNPDERPRDAAEALDWLYSTVDNRSIFRLEEHPMEVPDGENPAEDSRSSRKILFEEGTPSWLRKRETGGYGSVSDKAASKDEATSAADSDGRNGVRKRTGLVVGGVAALAIAGFFAVGALTGDDAQGGQETPATVATSAAAAAPDNDDKKASIDGVMTQVEEAIADQRFGVAGEMLASVEDRLVDNPELLSKAAGYRAAIKKGQLLIDARRYEKQQELTKAVDAYAKAVNLDPRDEAIQAKLNELQATSLLVIEPNVEATVLVDGKDLGKTPIKTLLPAEKVEIVLEADGYESWSKTIALPGGEEKALAPSLDKVRRPAPRPRPRPKPKKPANSGSDGLGGGGDDVYDDSLMKME